ncbi:MAG TPA: GDSL-type esterase/lipase family protein [Phycisphaerae bacterium]|nr:GDSL-type esterase/lipase family protein [Phycisphaerae bacterium]
MPIRTAFALGLSSASLLLASPLLAVPPSLPATFDFSAKPAPNALAVTDAYSPATGFGYDFNTRQTPDGKPFGFSAQLPEGNYKVTVTFGGDADSTTTVRAESRRLMLENIHTPAGGSTTESFAVNLRSPHISTGGDVGLDPTDKNSLDWDDKLSLAFTGTNVAVRRITIEKTTVPTLFVLGDSTVVDQPGPTGGSWAQSLPRWFDAGVAIANHAESGETLKAFRRPAERRWDKVLSQLQPGDYVFMQFGTNDSKNHGPNNIYPDEDFSQTYAPANTDYKNLLIQYATETKAKGATPVILSPMGRRADTHSRNSLGDYPQAALDAAKDAHCPAIDLNSLSIDVYLALGQGRRPRLQRRHPPQ